MSFSLHVCFMAAMLVYNNVQYSMGEKYFHCCYGATQLAILSIVSMSWTGSYLYYSMQAIDG